MLALSASPRARRESELIGPVGPGSRIEGEVDADSTTREIAIALTVEGERTHRTIEVDGARRRALDLPGHFRVALFWPDDLGLGKAGPELRRRFLNQMLVQVEPGYARSLAGLRRVLEQRNSLLKRIAAGEGGEDILDAWDAELVQVSREIVDARAKAARQLEPEAARCHAQIAAGERLEVRYLGPPENLAEAVHNSRAEDLRRGSTSVGPHRDDLLVLLDAQEARSFASQGQQRTAVVSLKLAEARGIESRSGGRPELLLDHGLSELDSDTLAAPLGPVGAGGQVIITSVEAASRSPALLPPAVGWGVSPRRGAPRG